MKLKLSHLIIVSVSFAAIANGADAIRGAAAVLKGVEEAAAKTNDSAPESEAAKLAAELERFKGEGGNLDSKTTAQRWIEIVTKYTETPPDRASLRQGKILSADQVIAALPPPSAWQELATAIRSRTVPKESQVRIRETALQLLAATLAGDTAGRQKLLAEIESTDPAAFGERYVWQTIQHVLDDLALRSTGSPDELVTALERRISRADPESGNTDVPVPDIVPLIGEQMAEAFFRRALTNKVELKLDHEGESTRRLARKVAASMVPQLKVPQWSLAHSIDAVELFEAMQARFQKQDADSDRRFRGSDYEFQSAKTYYLLGLIVGNRHDDAIKVAGELGRNQHQSLPFEALRALERAGYTEELAAFFHKLLSKDPELPFWETYFQLAAKAGQVEEMLAFARAMVAKVETAKTRAKLLEDFHLALLAADRVEEGVAELRKLLGPPPLRDSSANRGIHGLRLLRLGQLLNNNAWVEEGIAALRKMPADSAGMSYGETTLHDVIKVMAERNQGAEAEAILSEMLVAAGKEKADAYAAYRGSRGSAPLVALSFLYDQLGRHNDVLTLFDDAPYWGKRDIAEFLTRGYALPIMGKAEFAYSVPMLAARTLQRAGRNEQALQIVHAVLNTQPGDDAAYEMLIELDKQRALQVLDELFNRDMFEERPLIWKAHLLKEAGKLEEAEKTARQAIAIDPSDGEQGPGRRMRVYAVLADIREARGDKKEAEFLRGAVKAVRAAEQADRFYEAGLISRAVKMYKESLSFFTDAYCIQSRLAVQLAELGRHAEAEEHYRRAYELMPDSFGRVESHCFGCEHVFEGQRAQTLAEKVFTELAAKNPKKPQIHYLLGTLRQQQDRLLDAVRHFDDATVLDPDYLNAWEKLQSIANRLRTAPEKRDAAAFNILRLDPLQRHASPDFEDISDLRALWSAVERAQKVRPNVPSKLYPLRASAVELDKPKQGQMHHSYIDYAHIRESKDLSPGEALARTAWLRAVAQLLDASSRINAFN